MFGHAQLAQTPMVLPFKYARHALRAIWVNVGLRHIGLREESLVAILQV